MAAPLHDQSETIPGTIFTRRQFHLLKIAVVVMGIILVGGFALVLGTIVYQASNIGKSALRSGPPGAVDLPAAQAALTLKPGERISHMALDGDRLAVHVTGPHGGEIRVIDLGQGAVVARVPVKSE